MSRSLPGEQREKEHSRQWEQYMQRHQKKSQHRGWWVIHCADQNLGVMSRMAGNKVGWAGQVLHFDNPTLKVGNLTPINSLTCYAHELWLFHIVVLTELLPSFFIIITKQCRYYYPIFQMSKWGSGILRNSPKRHIQKVTELSIKPMSDPEPKLLITVLAVSW